MFTNADASRINGPVSVPVQPHSADSLQQAEADQLIEEESNLGEGEEVLVVDGRAAVGPAQQVENKLSTLLGGAPLPVSHVRMTALPGNRTHC
jgi:hypothetical protein